MVNEKAFSQQFATDSARWRAVSENNERADGIFFYAVKTTGVYCRPSCTSKLPRCENVEYFQTAREAEKAGYRACKKCKPVSASTRQETEEKIIRACRILEQSEVTIKLKDLAEKIELSPFHFHRLFKKIVGITPKQYAMRQRAQRFQQQLGNSTSVTDAIYSSGFGSSGSAYDSKREQLAMEPRTYRRGAAGITIMYGIASCFLGWVVVGATERGICAVEFGDEPKRLPDRLQQRFPKAKLEEGDAPFQEILREVVDFIESPRKHFQLPLDIQGTAFQQQVWELLRQIKPGETMSYSEVATRLGKPGANRAVASACSANALAVIIPCHRVISKSGKAGGYRWGAARKKKLLESEQEES